MSQKPPAGYTPIPNSKEGGYRKREGGKYVYWYADGKSAGSAPAEKKAPEAKTTTLSDFNNRLAKDINELFADLPIDNVKVSEIVDTTKTANHLVSGRFEVGPKERHGGYCTVKFGPMFFGHGDNSIIARLEVYFEVSSNSADSWMEQSSHIQRGAVAATELKRRFKDVLVEIPNED